MKVWITKYALSSGIKEVEAEICHDISENMIHVKGGKGTMDQCFHGCGKDWHTTYASAAKRAEKMRDAKIKSLRKKIDELSDMVWPA